MIHSRTLLVRWLSIGSTAVSLAIVTALFGSGMSAARPYEAPRITQYSQDIFAAGSNSGCRGAIHTGLKVDPQQRGRVFVTLTPRAFVGDGPGWRKNPTCKIYVQTAIDNPFNQNRHWNRTVTAGPRGGKSVKYTLRTGSGLHMISFGVMGLSFGNANYLIVP